jgi:hypothetical protein
VEDYRRIAKEATEYTEREDFLTYEEFGIPLLLEILNKFDQIIELLQMPPHTLLDMPESYRPTLRMHPHLPPESDNQSA